VRPWQFVTAECIHANPYFRVVRSMVRRPDASVSEYHTLDFERPAVSLLIHRSDEILLVHQHRFIVNREVWALPSGGVEPGETILEAGAREALEETGHAATNLRHLLSYFPSYGVSNQIFHCLIADDSQLRGEVDGNEVIKAEWVRFARVRKMILDGSIPDGFSLTPLAYFFAGFAPQSTETADRCDRVNPEESVKDASHV
jgi:ADP-ribose pyrophosphatase